MRHDVRELYKINDVKFYTEDYLETNNIPKANRRTHTTGWSVALYLGTNKDDFRIYTADGIKIGYAYGEKTWFDTREERDAYRAEQAIARAESARKNKIIKLIHEALTEMSEEELLEVLEKI